MTADGLAIVPVVLTALAKRFGRTSVLRSIELRIDAGEIVGLLGANGAGKTTLLSIIAGLLPASEGELRLGDVQGELDLAQRARLGFVAHTAQLYPRLTAVENLELFVGLRRSAGLPSSDPLALVERLGLGHARDRLVASFSRGMMQRLALARALLGQPQLLLLDEPFTALDRPGRQLLAQVLLEERSRGAAVLLSSHDFDAVAAVTDRAVILEEGVIAGAVARNETGSAGAVGQPGEADAAYENERYRQRVYDLAGRLERTAAPHAEPAPTDTRPAKSW